jgi:uncharacterized RDD family membrane protein YckC
MKCPKCGYLGFDQVDRCRNCGYEFSLAAVPEAELALKASSGESRTVDDLTFLKEPTVAAGSTPSSDLPLFATAGPDDEPLITRPSPPRPPLSVRRGAEAPRPRTESRAQSFELAFDGDLAEAPRPPLALPDDAESRAGADQSDLSPGSPLTLSPASAAAAVKAPVPIQMPAAAPAEATKRGGVEDERFHDASLIARLCGVVIDLFILAVVDVAVVYFTTQLCGITFFELGILPKAPLLLFVVLQNGGYIVGFTAGGQTLGKMVMGIRVVSAEEAEPIGVGRAFERTLLWAILAAPAGLGLLTALFSSDHRGLHDRMAGTRVVRASA